MVRVLVILVVLCTSLALADDVIWGFRSPGDYQLYRGVQIKSRAFLRVVTLDFTYPNSTVNPNQGPTIHHILLKDNTKKRGSKAVIKGGGPGARFANIHMKSKRNHDINYTVEIYGH